MNANCMNFGVRRLAVAFQKARRLRTRSTVPKSGSKLPHSKARGFTLVELLVVITIIGLLAGMAMGALAKAGEAGKLAATKATVAKLNELVMKRYESYRIRRVPLSFSGQNPKAVAGTRLSAIRELMRMEMPERWVDITANPTIVKRPALSNTYLAKYNAKNPPANSDHQQAKCLYLWVMTAMPEAKGLFRPEEIADVDKDGWKCFVDGWGHPIGFLRWAPGATAWSDIQVDDTGGANLHHDPFDPMMTEKTAYQLYPLIFAGVLSKVNGYDDYGIALGNGQVQYDFDVTKLTPAAPTADPYSAPYISSSGTVGSVLYNGTVLVGGVPLVHNHHMEMR